MSIADPMETTEFRVEHTINNLYASVRDLNDLRRSNEGRREIQNWSIMIDIEVCQDKLYLIFYDVGCKW